MRYNRIFKKQISVVAIIIFISLTGTSLAAQKMLIGSTSASSSHYGYFVAVSQIINEKVPGIETSVVETGAAVDNLRRIARKQIDLGLAVTNVLSQAYYGKEGFENAAVKSKLLWIYDLSPQNLVVRKDAGISKLPEIGGQRFNPGLKGSATEKTSEAVFKVLGITPDYIRGSTTDVTAAIKDNHIVGYVKSGAGFKLDASSRDISTFTPVTILSLNQDQVNRISSALPEVSIVDVPPGAGPGIDAYTTWAFGVGCSAGLDLDEDSAYKIVKAIFEDKVIQGNAMASVKDADLVQLTLKYATSPLHPGTIKYLREIGLDIPDRLIEK
jgi:uncharacterized protein